MEAFLKGGLPKDFLNYLKEGSFSKRFNSERPGRRKEGFGNPNLVSLEELGKAFWLKT